MSAFDAFFAWPNGGIWSNLLASGICLVLGFIAGAVGVRKVAKGIHAKLDRHHELLLRVHAKVSDPDA